MDLDGWRVRRLGRRPGPRAQPRAPLRHGRLRGHPLLRDRGGPAVFRHTEHLQRLANSAEMYYLPLPYSVEEIREATHELIRRNGLSSCYIRPIAFRGYGEMGLYAQSAPVNVTIAVWPWGAYLGEEGKRHGIRAKVSSWRRISAGRADPAREGLRPVPELDPGEDGVGERRLRRGDPARRARLRLRGLGREHLLRARGRARHPAARGRDPRRDQPQVGDPDRPRPRLHGGRARHRALRALPRRGDLPLRHRRRARARCARSTTTRSASRARSPG